jgi:hypothetical protein
VWPAYLENSKALLAHDELPDEMVKVPFEVWLAVKEVPLRHVRLVAMEVPRQVRLEVVVVVRFEVPCRD